jgi:transcriptional regulator with AAA-type ATPase domain/transcriptional regulatory protein LevR/mannitol/fructose-specific phosphotransferase system IIA component (Ntr-type)
MKEQIRQIIATEDMKNPLSDQAIAKLLGVRRELVTLTRKEMGVLNSRARRERILAKRMTEIIRENESLSERELTDRLKEEGFQVSRQSVRTLKGKLEELNIDEELPIGNETEINRAKRNQSNHVAAADVAFNTLIGASGSMKHSIQQSKAAMLYPPHGLHTLILGETGVGKSELAHAMFDFAKKQGVVNSNSDMILFNCADYADNPQLLMAQLFGYVKGAFTGAEKDRKGLVEQANGSILFLDEVHRLPPEGQELLFYLIDKGRFRRLGETDATRKAQVTIVAATTENPDSNLLMTFRRRIPMVIEVPNLAERPIEERVEIVHALVSREAFRTNRDIRVTNEAIRCLLLYDCPGNVGQLKSDVQVSAARGFLKQVVGQSKEIVITVDELPQSAKRGMLKYEGNRQVIEELVGLNDFQVGPDMGTKKVFIKDGLYGFSQEIYQYIEQRYADLKSQELGDELVNYMIGNETENKLKQLVHKFEANVKPIKKNELANIVGFETISIVDQMIRIAKRKLEIDGDRLYYVLAIHVSTTIERLKEGKTVRNPNLENIKRKHAYEYSVALEMVQIIENEIDLVLPEDEAGFIAMYLNMMEKEEDDQARVGVIVVSHGTVAQGMADVANRLLGVNHCRSVCMSLDEKPEAALARTLDMVKNVDEGRGVLLLVDMGSLVTFGEIITRETSIRTRSLGRVDTLMVIEGVRRAMLPNADLDVVADTLEEDPKYISRIAKRQKTKHKEFALITICITGEGSALKIMNLVRNITQDYEENIHIIPIGAIDENLNYLIRTTMKRYNVLGILGTVNPNVPEVPFFSLEEMIHTEGVNRLHHLLERSIPYPSRSKGSLQALFDVNRIWLDEPTQEKEAIIRQMAAPMIAEGIVTEGFVSAVLERETEGVTVLDNGIAIPHADPRTIRRNAVSFMRLKTPILWKDGFEIQFIFLLAFQEDAMEWVLSLHELFQDLEFINQLKTFHDKEVFIKSLKN